MFERIRQPRASRPHTLRVLTLLAVAILVGAVLRFSRLTDDKKRSSVPLVHHAAAFDVSPPLASLGDSVSHSGIA
jgi:hypothetical protein